MREYQDIFTKPKLWRLLFVPYCVHVFICVYKYEGEVLIFELKKKGDMLLLFMVML